MPMHVDNVQAALDFIIPIKRIADEYINASDQLKRVLLNQLIKPNFRTYARTDSWSAIRFDTANFFEFENVTEPQMRKPPSQKAPPCNVPPHKQLGRCFDRGSGIRMNGAVRCAKNRFTKTFYLSVFARYSALVIYTLLLAVPLKFAVK